MDIRKIFGTNLKKYRKLRGLTQEKLAEKVNLSVPYIGAIEIGQKFPSPEKMNSLILVLNISPYLLFVEDQLSFEKTREIINKKVDELMNEIMSAVIPSP